MTLHDAHRPPLSRSRYRPASTSQSSSFEDMALGDGEAFLLPRVERRRCGAAGAERLIGDQ
jgi:hypothetical protein